MYGHSTVWQVVWCSPVTPAHLPVQMQWFSGWDIPALYAWASLPAVLGNNDVGSYQHSRLWILKRMLGRRRGDRSRGVRKLKAAIEVCCWAGVWAGPDRRRFWFWREPCGARRGWAKGGMMQEVSKAYYWMGERSRGVRAACDHDVSQDGLITVWGQS